MIDRIEQLERDALAAIDAAADLKAVEAAKAKFLGRQDGALTVLLRNLRELPASERPAAGARANLAKNAIEARLEGRLAALGKAEQDKALAAAAVDITLPGRKPARGALHPLTRTMNEIIDVFVRMGFSVERGPEVESDYLNFEALNFPDHHPARDMQDTFFVGDETGVPTGIAHPHAPKNVPMLLRTHTSPVQIRTMMREKKPPVRMIAPGAVYRHDSDQTHSPVFHQVEGLMVDRNVSMADLKGVLLEFARAMFGPKSGIRLRPSFFPFVEPGVEVDISCFRCTPETRAECRVCKASGWMEILGAGMVHPNVFRAVGFDPDQVQGFAFGLGVERIAMLQYRVPDIRLFFENDLRFLEQFK